MGDFATGKVQSDVELITGAPALVVAKLETKAPELFAQLAATGGATDEEKLQQLPLSLAAFLRLHDGAWQIYEYQLLPLAQIGAGSHGVCSGHVPECERRVSMRRLHCGSLLCGACEHSGTMQPWQLLGACWAERLQRLRRRRIPRREWAERVPTVSVGQLLSRGREHRVAVRRGLLPSNARRDRPGRLHAVPSRLGLRDGQHICECV